MEEQGLLYSQFFKSQDRFLNAHKEKVFSSEVILDYVYWGKAIGSHYEQHSEHESTLLCELFLRQVFFHLIDAIQDRTKSMIFRRVSYDSIHSIMICLKRYYYQCENGEEAVHELTYNLQRVVSTMDY